MSSRSPTTATTAPATAPVVELSVGSTVGLTADMTVDLTVGSTVGSTAARVTFTAVVIRKLAELIAMPLTVEKSLVRTQSNTVQIPVPGLLYEWQTTQR